MVSISPVPKLEPGPVSYFQFADDPGAPAAPEKPSLNTVVQPEGGGGTVVAKAGPASPMPATKAVPKSAQTTASTAMGRCRAAQAGVAGPLSYIGVFLLPQGSTECRDLRQAAGHGHGAAARTPAAAMARLPLSAPGPQPPTPSNFHTPTTPSPP